MAPSRSKSKPKITSLKSGRPPTLTSTSNPSTLGSQSAKHTRTLIRQHHTLQKRLSHAKSINDTSLVADLESQLAATGGLKSYQVASTIGQSKTRGGDSSRVLVEWLHDEIQIRRKRSHSESTSTSTSTSHSRPPLPLKILEIGALSTSNALNVNNVTRVRRIDLRSSGPGIEEIDFMALPLPTSSTDPQSWDYDRPGYDVVSLSLVLNYVPDAQARGAMLRRTTRFFREAELANTSDADADADADIEVESSKAESSDRTSTSDTKLPCLFLVLPGACVHNSRYLTVGHLTDIMNALGYCLLNDKTTAKLYYSLWRWDGRDRLGESRPHQQSGPRVAFRKREINPGATRNNFCIVLDGQD
ncbi:hypothetical protein PV10_05777 [Exophiala mesophila]|uniref:25S rRNA adenine-N(1) methyltransferase n=1 Tax=Exophiala mesophila TaxID=212818 RepID=A0A0D1WQ73_EXOME|nr:uncharacterized protein PV10_05777 [Exophiala mesophila]KIV91215.1 hypothetical protein PV10_05777 [Exophiala mesophila]